MLGVQNFVGVSITWNCFPITPSYTTEEVIAGQISVFEIVFLNSITLFSFT